jgi:hypothetical protein
MNINNSNTPCTSISGKRKLIEFWGHINGVEAKILVDTGAQSNFISTKFVNAFELPRTQIPRPISVHMADGTNYVVGTGVTDADPNHRVS